MAFIVRELMEHSDKKIFDDGYLKSISHIYLTFFYGTFTPYSLAKNFGYLILIVWRKLLVFKLFNQFFFLNLGDVFTSIIHCLVPVPQ